MAAKYINCRYHPGNIFDLCITDNWFCVDGKLYYQHLNITKDLIGTFGSDCIYLLRKMINLGYYPYGMYNEQYIPGKSDFQNSYFEHDYLLIGYDDEKQLFYSVGYLADRKFQKFNIAYDSMKQAIESLRCTTITFYFFKYNSNAKYVFDSDFFLKELFDYINSKTSAKLFRTDTYFGMQAISKMANDLLINAKQKKRIDNRYTRALLEHKFLMMKRVDFLVKNLGLNLLDIPQKTMEIYKMAENVHFLGIKYRITNQSSIAEHILETINKMLSIENEFLPMLYECVKHTQKEGLLQ